MANRSRIFLRGRLLQGPLVHAAALVAAAAQIKHRPSVCGYLMATDRISARMGHATAV